MREKNYFDNNITMNKIDFERIYDQHKKDSIANLAHFNKTIKFEMFNGPHKQYWIDLTNFIREKGISIDLNSGKGSINSNYVPFEFKFKDLEKRTHQVEVILIRHGVTNRNQEPRSYNGYIEGEDSQLNSVGKNQANELAQILLKSDAPDIIYQSPLTRAQETIRPYLSHLTKLPDIITNNDLAEMGWGAQDGCKVIDSDSLTYPFLLPSTTQNMLAKDTSLPADYNCPVATTPEETNKRSENFVEVLSKTFHFLESMKTDIQEKINTGNNVKKIFLINHAMICRAINFWCGNVELDSKDKTLIWDGITKQVPQATPFIINPTHLAKNHD